MAFQLLLRATSALTCLLLLSPYSAYAQSSSAASSTSSSSSSAPASTTSAATSSTGKNTKRGLSYPDSDNIADILNINQTNSLISWQYDWGLTPPANLAESGVQYVPMQWGSGGIENLSATLSAQKADVLLVRISSTPSSPSTLLIRLTDFQRARL